MTAEETVANSKQHFFKLCNTANLPFDEMQWCSLLMFSLSSCVTPLFMSPDADPEPSPQKLERDKLDQQLRDLQARWVAGLDTSIEGCSAFTKQRQSLVK